ncbi:MAG: hypothetical protein DLM59_18530 [Pseudonocardiales bacterium]|nr:MAG: hypothetical protein DLM59_18530 [Pseudonocardiales bacterium]
MTSQPDLLKPPEAAQLVRMSVETLKRWRRQGIGPQSTRVGPRAIRYDRGEVERWLRSNGRPAA